MDDPDLVEGQPARLVPWRPAAALRPFLRTMTAYDVRTAGPGTHRGLPSTHLTLILPVRDPIDVGWHGWPGTRGQHWSCVSGLHPAAAEIHHHGRQAGIQLDLTPAGARRLLGLPPGALAGALVPVHAVSPALADLPEQLAAATTWQDRLRQVETRLLQLLAQTPSADPRPELSWALHRLHRPTTVATVAGEVGLSRRQLGALFRAEYGVTPKQFQRIARFEASHRVLTRQLRTGRAALAEIAAGCGFADQAHLTREWSALAGYSPTEWLRQEFPYLQDAVVDSPVA